MIDESEILKETTISKVNSVENVEIKNNIINKSQVTEAKEISIIYFNDPSSWPPITDKMSTLLINHGPKEGKT